MFVLAYDNKPDNNEVSINSFKKHFLPKNHNIEIDGRNFYDQPINDSINNTTKSEKYQKDKVMITPLVVCCILLILEKIAD